MTSAGEKIELRPDPAELAAMRDFVRSRARASGLDEAGAFDACLVATEAVTNAIRHGRGPRGGQEPIEVACGPEPHGFFVEVGDHGRFVPKAAATGDELGGRGLGLIKRLTQRFELGQGGPGTRLWMLLGRPERVA